MSEKMTLERAMNLAQWTCSTDDEARALKVLREEVIRLWRAEVQSESALTAANERAKRAEVDLGAALVRIDMMNITGIREIPSAAALLDRAERAESRLKLTEAVVEAAKPYETDGGIGCGDEQLEKLRDSLAALSSKESHG